MIKRNKIKQKYLNKINNTTSNINIYDKIEKIIISSLKTIGLILLLLIWSSIPTLILYLLHIDYNNMNSLAKILILFPADILFLIFLITIYHKTVIKDFKNYFYCNLKNNIKESFSTWLIGFGIMIVSNLIIAILTNGQLAQNEENVRELISTYPIYMAFQLILYAPLSEELIFRKSIKDITNNKKIYILLSGLIFGGLHVITSLNNPLGFLYLIPYCSLGCIFAYLYHKTNNIFSTITAHSIHNTLALLIYLKGLN